MAMLDAFFGQGWDKALARSELFAPPGRLHSLSMGVRHLRGVQPSYYWLSATFEERSRKGPGLPVMPVGPTQVQFRDAGELDAPWQWILDVSSKRALPGGPWLDEQMWCTSTEPLSRKLLEQHLADMVNTLPCRVESVQLDLWADDRSPAHGAALIVALHGREGAANPPAARARLWDGPDGEKELQLLREWGREVAEQRFQVAFRETR